MVKKCKIGFIKKGNKCVKNNGSFRLSWEVPTNFGMKKKNIKMFGLQSIAKKEFRKRLKKLEEDVKKNDFEGGEGVILEDIKKDVRVRSRIVNEDGEIQNFDWRK